MNTRLINTYLKCSMNYPISLGTKLINAKIDRLVRWNMRPETIKDWVMKGRLQQKYELIDDIEFQIKQLEWEELKEFNKE